MEIRAIQSGAKTFRGNLHTHTTVSDGRRSPEEAAIWYRDNGYDFVAITDHWKTLEPLSVDGILVIPGVEYHANDPELGAFQVGSTFRSAPREATIMTTEMASYITAWRTGRAVPSLLVWHVLLGVNGSRRIRCGSVQHL